MQGGHPIARRRTSINTYLCRLWLVAAFAIGSFILTEVAKDAPELYLLSVVAQIINSCISCVIRGNALSPRDTPHLLPRQRLAVDKIGSYSHLFSMVALAYGAYSTDRPLADWLFGTFVFSLLIYAVVNGAANEERFNAQALADLPVAPGHVPAGNPVAVQNQGAAQNPGAAAPPHADLQEEVPKQLNLDTFERLTPTGSVRSGRRSPLPVFARQHAEATAVTAAPPAGP